MTESVSGPLNEGFDTPRPGAEAQPSTNTEPLDSQRAAKIMFVSFRLSQGDGQFQNKIFSYLHAANPSLKIANTDKVTEQTTDLIMDMFHPGGPDTKGHYLRRLIDAVHRGEDDKKDYYPRKTTAAGVHARIKTDRIIPQVKDQVEMLRGALNSQSGSSGTPEQLAPSLVSGFIVRDAHFFNKGGRERANPDSKRVITDPYSSSTIEYVMRGRSTGVAEFNEMCSTLRTHILQQVAHPTSEWTDNTGRLLESVISTYNIHHAQEQQYTLPSSEEASQELQRLSNNTPKDNVSEDRGAASAGLPDASAGVGEKD